MGSLITAIGNSSRALFEMVLGEPRLSLVRGGGLASLGHLVSLFSRSDEASESLLREKFSELRLGSELTEYEAFALVRLTDLMDLRALAFGRNLSGSGRIRQAFVKMERAVQTPSDFEVSLQDITAGATRVAELYLKLLDTCRGSIPELRAAGLELYFSLFGSPFESLKGSERISTLVDRIQQDRGVAFLIFSLIRQGALSEAREIAKVGLQSGIEIEEEETFNSLYWFAETLWFGQRWSDEKLSYEDSMRLLYHLCFAAPERAGFLEVDSQFFSEFESVNELALEAFSYRETLVENVLTLWGRYEGEFDSLFQRFFETVVGRKSKIFDHRGSWEKAWKKRSESFSREYLFLVEGNLCFAVGDFESAAQFYESALEINPTLRPALLNLLFAYSKLNRMKDHLALAERLASEKSLLPSALYAIGDSFLLAVDEQTADSYFDLLKSQAGWDKKLDYYKSTFCFQHGLFAQSVRFGRAALVKNPGDDAIIYHLSLCHAALGEKAKALEVLNRIEKISDLPWLLFFRFTLEKEMGDADAAAKTLSGIPLDYFEDETELDVALSFAKSLQDLGLVRQLKNKKATPR
jgi:tetratricopeptide (TPR) repeat protein